MNTGKILLGALAGIAIGASLGVIFAPAKGSKTRKRILKKSEDSVDAVKEKFNEFLESITEKFDKIKEDVSDFAEETRSKAKEAQKSRSSAKG
jgi:gas vesicle protein